MQVVEGELSSQGLGVLYLAHACELPLIIRAAAAPASAYLAGSARLP